MYHKFGVHVGVPNTAANLAIYGEIGRTPLDIRHNVLMVKYWLRLTTDWEISPYLREAYLNSLGDSCHGSLSSQSSATSTKL